MPSLLQKPWFAESIQCWVGYPKHVSEAILSRFSLRVHYSILFSHYFPHLLVARKCVLCSHLNINLIMFCFICLSLCRIIDLIDLQEIYRSFTCIVTVTIYRIYLLEYSVLHDRDLLLVTNVLYITGFIAWSILVLHDRDLLLLVTNVLTVHGRQKKG